MPDTREIPAEALRKLTDWLNQPLTPGKQKELTEWLSADSENQLKWDRWLDFNTSAKQLQIVPTEADAQWRILRDELQFGRSTNKRSRRSRRRKRKSPLKSPIVVAFLSMIVFSLFLLALFVIRSGAKF